MLIEKTLAVSEGYWCRSTPAVSRRQVSAAIAGLCDDTEYWVAHFLVMRAENTITAPLSAQTA